MDSFGVSAGIATDDGYDGVGQLLRRETFFFSRCFFSDEGAGELRDSHVTDPCSAHDGRTTGSGKACETCEVDDSISVCKHLGSNVIKLRWRGLITAAECRSQRLGRDVPRESVVICSWIQSVDPHPRAFRAQGRSGNESTVW